jgi:hypothetical protein
MMVICQEYLNIYIETLLIKGDVNIILKGCSSRESNPCQLIPQSDKSRSLRDDPFWGMTSHEP